MKQQGTVLVTGASGFVGHVLVPHLLGAGMKVVAVYRGALPEGACKGARWVRMTSIGPESDWRPLLEGCDAVVHLAARVHVMAETVSDPLAEFRQVNVAGTERLASHAAQIGVKRFVYLSSVKVNGEETSTGCAFRPDDEPAPEDHYGVSKHEAELALRRIESATGLEVCIIRPPLIHGPAVKGNLRVMMRWLARGVPLPFAALENRRSMVGLDNLAHLVGVCLNHPKAGGETFLVSDGRDISTPELLSMTARSMGRMPRLFSVPPAILTDILTFLGKRELARRLCGNLQVDISKTKDLLGWAPGVDIEVGLKKMAAAER
ncbi:MAG: NAD-dependent epimerase/dehydratase family protein [Rhodocyclaceae bacterium]|nr:NAD-dependent epimerase/dehydratase family protein [Rhodocyclaceae bacterium]